MVTVDSGQVNEGSPVRRVESLIALVTALGLGSVAVGVIASQPAGATNATAYAHLKYAVWFEQVRGDFAQLFVTEVQDLITDMQHVITDHEKKDVATFRNDCTKIEGTVQNLRAAAPIPNAQLERYWKRALSDMANVATACINGINNNDNAKIESAASDVSNATALIKKITKSS
jgi:hypothetical protein